MRAIAFALIALLLATQARSAETMLGPTFHVCRDVTRNMEGASLTLMWVVGYVSGLNNLSQVDFLRGRSMEAIIDHFRDTCLSDPSKTVLEASREVVAKLRIEYLGRYRQNSK